ncbi:MAG: CvpA family protein [Thermanaerothrix sp.]|nr:CvpA family protein [Thermanaerothrix sp.]
MTALPWSPLDWILAFAGGVWILRGVFRGFVAELASLLGLALGFVLAARYSKSLIPLLVEMGIPPFGCSILAFVLVGAASVVLCRALGGVVKSIISKANLSLLDRLLGGAFGAVKLALLVLILFVMGRAVSPFLAPGWEERSFFLSAVSSHQELISGLFDVMGVVPHGGLMPGLPR